MVKNPPANAGDVGLIPGSGRSLEEEMPTYSRILAMRISWTEEPGGPQFLPLQSQTRLSDNSNNLLSFRNQPVCSLFIRFLDTILQTVF